MSTLHLPNSSWVFLLNEHWMIDQSSVWELIKVTRVIDPPVSGSSVEQCVRLYRHCSFLGIFCAAKQMRYDLGAHREF